MKKKILFAVLIIIAAGLTVFWVADKNSPKTTGIKQQDLKELKITKVETSASEGVSSNKYAFRTKDNGVIQMGTERYSPPKPYVQLDKWDGEVSLKVRIPFETGDNPTIIGDKIRYSTTDKPLAANPWQKLSSLVIPWANAVQPRVDIDIYPKTPDEQHTDGGMEFDIIFYEKPGTNQIIFPIEAQDLNFFYQPVLNEEVEIGKDGVMSCTETDCFDASGNNIIQRPENVVGSYAVYHKTKRDDYSLMGGENYRTGKAFHIYRPKVVDNQGDWVWGELDIDIEQSILTIIVDKEWLDKAAYPVTIDPDFGYTSVGQTNWSTSINRIYSAGGTPDSSGIVTSVSVYGRYFVDSSSFKGILILQSDKTIITNGITSGTSLPVAANDWTPATFSVNPSISSVAYYVGFILSNVGILKGDTTGGPGGLYDSTNSYANPTNPTDGSTVTYTYSIFARYAVPTPTPTPVAGGINFENLNMQGINVN